MNAIPLQDEDLEWADLLEDDKDLPFNLWVTSTKDGDCFLVWVGTFEKLADYLSRAQHERARRCGAMLLEASDIFDR